MKKFFPILLFPLIMACTTSEKSTSEDSNIGSFIGTWEKFDPALDEIVNTTSNAEIIAEGFDWSEGPLWVENEKMLLFSDVPQNTVYKWTESRGTEVYLKPSGYTGNTPEDFREPGSNGLALDAAGNLVLCQHGDRQIGQMKAPLSAPHSSFKSLASSYEDKKFNSPNDLAISTTGEIYFTDPPYGLKGMAEDPKIELPFNGVYKIKTDGTVILLLDSITRPNGIALFPSNQRLLVTNSDRANLNIYVYDIAGDSLTNPQIFYSSKDRDPNWKGSHDGLKIDQSGNVFATGPGGIYVFNSAGTKLGMLHLHNASSNCALSADEQMLFITNDNYVLRVKMR